MSKFVFVICAALLAFTSPAKPNSASHKEDALFEAKQFVSIGRYDDVLVKLRAALLAGADPVAVRLILIDVLSRQGQKRRAEGLAQHLIRRSNSEQEVAVYRAALAELYRRNPFSFTGSFNLRPGTNITRSASGNRFRTNLGTFRIENGGQERSGLGAEVSVGVTHRSPIANGVTLELSGALTRVFYDEPTLRFWQGVVSADLIFRDSGRDLQFGTYISQSRYDIDDASATDSPDLRRIGTTARLTTTRGNVTRTLSARLERRNFAERDTFDGTFASFRASWSTSIGKKGTFRWGGGLDRLRPDLEFHRYKGLSLHFEYTRAITQKFTLGVDFDARLRRFDTQFPFVSFERADDIVTVGLSASHRALKIAGRSPTLRCAHTQHRSNIALFDTSYSECSVSFSYDF